MIAPAWNAIVLAAGRGPGDPMAKAYGVSHKCALPICGVPMLVRAVQALSDCRHIGSIAVAIESASVGQEILGTLSGKVEFIASLASAAQSAAGAVHGFPTLLTTGDHPLLTTPILDHFLSEAEKSNADLAVGLASAETILSVYPQAKRTFIRFGRDRASGCNLFALRTEKALKAVEFWQYLEPLRKKPWRLVSAFGPMALARFAVGAVDLEAAFAIASKRLELKAVPVLIPYADAAVDVDKPADKELAETILQARAAATSQPPSSAPAASRPESPPRTR